MVNIRENPTIPSVLNVCASDDLPVGSEQRSAKADLAVGAVRALFG
jgi:hypothetical protein